MKALAKWRQRAGNLRGECLALYLAYRDPRVPWYAKAVALGVVAYALSPIDLIPDWIPVLGYLDDVLIIPLGVAVAIRLVPPAVFNDCRGRALQMDHSARKVARIGAVAVVILWSLLALLAVLITRRILVGK